MGIKAKITKVDEHGTPKCPHCSDPVFSATVTIEALMDHYPLGGWFGIGDDGYAREGEHLTASCGSCHKPFVIGFNDDPETWFQWQIKLGAARTKKDEAYINPDPMSRFFEKAVRAQAAIHCGPQA